MTRANKLMLQVDDFLERYRKGERNFAGIGLQKNRSLSTIIDDVDLSGINLSGADLTGVSFTNVILRNARMFGTFLCAARFSLVDMDDADLTGATLKNVGIFSCSMVGVSLELADLSFATLRDVDLECALLENCNLTQTNLSEIGSRTGIPHKMRDWRAHGAILWNTVLPNGQRIVEATTFDKDFHKGIID